MPSAGRKRAANSAASKKTKPPPPKKTKQGPFHIHPPKKTSAKAEPKKTKQGPFNLHGPNNELLLTGLKNEHQGKRLLLKAKELYKGINNVPNGEERYLFQYHILTVNNDLVSATIEFDERYVEEDGHQFFNYPNPDANTNTTIPGYSLSQVKVDHELFNVSLGRENKRINDKREEEARAAETERVVWSADLSDIAVKLKESRCNFFSVLVNEFKPHGNLLDHTIGRGPKAGQQTKKQQWIHKFSSYQFMWQQNVGKTDFEKHRLYKATRQIIAEQRDGYERLKAIMQYMNRPVDADDANAFYTRDEDMVNRVNSVAGSVGSKTPLGIFDNNFIRKYLKGLNSKHRPPHRLERIRIAETMVDAGMLEFARIVKV
jgi:hypothetical protein